jgi:hypothetical protein
MEQIWKADAFRRDALIVMGFFEFDNVVKDFPIENRSFGSMQIFQCPQSLHTLTLMKIGIKKKYVLSSCMFSLKLT